jgi:hypothetical protein
VTRRAYILAAALAALAAGRVAAVEPPAGPPADVTVSLEPAPSQRAAMPYAAAVLTVENAADVGGPLIEAVAVRPADGGPTLVRRAEVAPQARQTLTVELPVVSVRQEYDVRLLAGAEPGSPAVAERRAVVNWPAALFAEPYMPLIDARPYRAWEGRRSLPHWPQGLLRSVFVAAVLFCVALSATLLIRRPGLRAACVLLLAGAAAVAAVAALPLAAAGDVPVVADFAYCPPAATRPARQDLLALTCRRTARWRRVEAGLVPIYDSRQQMAADTMVVEEGGVVSVRLRPDDVRLFRRR